MADSNKPAVPRSFYIIAVLALLWNLTGVAAYLMQMTMSPEALAALPEAQRAFYTNMPAWVVSAFAVAVFAGLGASVMLVIRNGQAVPLFFVSLLAAIVQNVYGFVIADGLAVFGASGLVLPALVIVLGIVFLLYANSCRKRGWL